MVAASFHMRKLYRWLLSEVRFTVYRTDVFDSIDCSIDYPFHLGSTVHRTTDAEEILLRLFCKKLKRNRGSAISFLSLSLTLTLSPGFSLFFRFSPFLSLLFAVIEGITDLFVVPAARYTVASLFRNKMDFAHSGNDRNQYCSSAFRMMMHRIQIFPDSLVWCWYSTFCIRLCAELLAPSAAATDSDKLLQKNSIRPML